MTAFGRNEESANVRNGDGFRVQAGVRKLALLDPQLVKDCIDGRTTLSLTASDLAYTVELPTLWAHQHS
jgi:hypothetical protein